MGWLLISEHARVPMADIERVPAMPLHMADDLHTYYLMGVRLQLNGYGMLLPNGSDKHQAVERY